MMDSTQHKNITDFDVYYFETGYEEQGDDDDHEHLQETVDEPRKLTSRE